MPDTAPLYPLWVSDSASLDAMAVDALARALDTPVRRVHCVGDASGELAGKVPLVVVDSRRTPDWREAMSVVAFLAPDAVVIAWDAAERGEAERGELVDSALRGGVDKVCGGAEGANPAAWARVVSRARARAAARRRTETDGHYRVFFEQTPFPATLLDGNGRIIGPNLAFRTTFGATDGADAARSIFDLFTRESLETEAAPVWGVVAGKTDLHSRSSA